MPGVMTTGISPLPDAGRTSRGWLFRCCGLCIQYIDSIRPFIYQQRNDIYTQKNAFYFSCEHGSGQGQKHPDQIVEQRRHGIFLCDAQKSNAKSRESGLD
jgi:hypothetical protein